MTLYKVYSFEDFKINKNNMFNRLNNKNYDGISFCYYADFWHITNYFILQNMGND